MNRIESGGTANYNGLVFSLQRRPVKGVGFSANYTWSHCISDYYLDIANSGNANAGWTDPNNRSYDRGNCTGGAEDRRHIFNLSGTAASPQFSNRTLRLIATGWQVAPIFRIMSGQALIIEDTTDPGLIFMIAATAQCDGQSLRGWIDHGLSQRQGVLKVTRGHAR